MRVFTVNRQKQTYKIILLTVVVFSAMIFFSTKAYYAHGNIPAKQVINFSQTEDGTVITDFSFVDQMHYENRQREYAQWVMLIFASLLGGLAFFYFQIYINDKYVIDDHGIKSYSLKKESEPRVIFEWDSIKSIQMGYTYGSMRRYPIYAMKIRYEFEGSRGNVLNAVDMLPIFRIENYKELKLYLKQTGDKVGVEVFEMDD